MINNFKKISELLQFDSDDEFYFVQIIKRKKENPELGSNNVVVHSYYISSAEQLLKLENEIALLTALHNARAYINLNRCSYERVAFQTLKNVADRIMNKDFRSVKRAYNTCCGQFTIENLKKWVIDVDCPEGMFKNDVLYQHFLNEILFAIKDIEPIGDKHVATIETRNGFHLITTPFNMEKFSKLYPNVDVHKNNPTLLYY